MKGTNVANMTGDGAMRPTILQGRRYRRSYAEEMAHAISRAISANHDRNPNRAAEVNGWLQWGHDVAIARRGHEPIPPRPTRTFI